MTDAADEGRAPNQHPVGIVPDGRLAVGAGVLPLFLSHDWSVPMPEIDLAVILLHGRRRDAETYRQILARAADGVGDSLLIVPQFLAGIDIRQHGLPDPVLRWSLEGWMGGEPAEGPVPASSFEAVDAILAHLNDRSNFPALRRIVLAGHSGGAQVVQRYAVIGRGGAALEAAGKALRYVVANPSSYVYFSPDRPFPVEACPDFDRWKYGMNALPPYAGAVPTAALETEFARREVVYLWGGEDSDTEQPALDRSCAAQAQGPHRLARGQAYFAYLQARHADLAHRAAIVPGVGHDGAAMFCSALGRAALFD